VVPVTASGPRVGLLPRFRILVPPRAPVGDENIFRFDATAAVRQGTKNPRHFYVAGVH